MSDANRDFNLIMPFVVCQSKGGPYDDNAYVAGYEAGALDQGLRALNAIRAVPTLPYLIHADNRPQVDLIAMRRGFSVIFVETADGWCEATFSKAAVPSAGN